MSASSPHYLLFSESRFAARPGADTARGRWRFVLESLDGREHFEAADEEPGAAGQRLDLLAVVRGLEALDQPSRVTLVTSSTYVSRGLRFGLAEWRANDWMWERFGKMTPVKDSDLWQRVDRALRFHHVECRTWRFCPEAQLAATAALPPTPEANHAASQCAAASSLPWRPGWAALVALGGRLVDVWRQCLIAAASLISSPLTASGNLR